MYIPTKFKSSADPNKLSITVKGVLLALVPGILYLLGLVGLKLTDVSLIEIINQGAIALSSILVIYGLLRKAILKKN